MFFFLHLLTEFQNGSINLSLPMCIFICTAIRYTPITGSILMFNFFIVRADPGLVTKKNSNLWCSTLKTLNESIQWLEEIKKCKPYLASAVLIRSLMFLTTKTLDRLVGTHFIKK